MSFCVLLWIFSFSLPHQYVFLLFCVFWYFLCPFFLFFSITCLCKFSFVFLCIFLALFMLSFPHQYVFPLFVQFSLLGRMRDKVSVEICLMTDRLRALYYSTKLPSQQKYQTKMGLFSALSWVNGNNSNGFWKYDTSLSVPFWSFCKCVSFFKSWDFMK